jgi:hypothetical protein
MSTVGTGIGIEGGTVELTWAFNVLHCRLFILLYTKNMVTHSLVLSRMLVPD